MTTKIFKYKTCKNPECGLLYQPVTWLMHRTDGYCSKKCVPKKEVKK